MLALTEEVKKIYSLSCPDDDKLHRNIRADRHLHGHYFLSILQDPE